MELLTKIINNRYTYALYLSCLATVLSCLGFLNLMTGSSSAAWAMVLLLGILLSACAYCLGGLLTAIKSALSIASWGWVVVPFPYDLVTFPVAFVVSIFVFFLAPVIPIYKARKKHG